MRAPLFLHRTEDPGDRGYPCLKSARPVLEACAVNAEQDASGAGDADRNEGYPVSRLNEVAEVVNYVVDKYRFDFFKWQVKFTGEIAGRTPSGRDVHLGRG